MKRKILGLILVLGLILSTAGFIRTDNYVKKTMVNDKIMELVLIENEQLTIKVLYPPSFISLDDYRLYIEVVLHENPYIVPFFYITQKGKEESRVWFHEQMMFIREGEGLVKQGFINLENLWPFGPLAGKNPERIDYSKTFVLRCGNDRLTLKVKGDEKLNKALIFYGCDWIEEITKRNLEELDKIKEELLKIKQVKIKQVK